MRTTDAASLIARSKALTTQAKELARRSDTLKYRIARSIDKSRAAQAKAAELRRKIAEHASIHSRTFTRAEANRIAASSGGGEVHSPVL